ncbi:hypothetical protein [Chitinophaga sp. CF418]|uniref:hypothetical protein n=1 Tax=Chitinophaga sp. CF418 TaxID=1855287 RepID=UPI00091E9D78|nr:hypothetical protein [Chitinophaga sp. CF418]SHN34282.1 hypothetical protein SAMN05216311_109267 [Chitinophaga sp. CF418]
MIVSLHAKKLILAAILWHIFRIARATDMVTEIQYSNIGQVASAIMKINGHSQRRAGVNNKEEYGGYFSHFLFFIFYEDSILEIRDI